MKKIVIILSLIVFITSCKKDSDEPRYYYFNTEEQNLLGFELNESISLIDNHGDEYNLKVTKDSLYHRKSILIGGTVYVQHNDIILSSTDANNFFIIILAEKTKFFEYKMEIKVKEYFYFDFNSSIHDFEIIDTVIDNVELSGLYALRSQEIVPQDLDTKSLILMNSESGIVLIERRDENSDVIFRLRKE